MDEDTGTLVVFGDFGTWSHTWGHAGRMEENRQDFRGELLRFSSDYIERKLALYVPQVLNPDKTRKGLKQFCLQERRNKELSREDARAIWEVAESIESEGDLQSAAFRCDALDIVLGEMWFEPTYERHNQAWLDTLMGQHWPVVLASLKEGLAEHGQK